MMVLFVVFLIALALLGANAMCIIAFMNYFDMSLDEAKVYQRENLKDIFYRRSNCNLYYSDFPQMVKNDISDLFSEDVVKKWDNIIKMRSTITDFAGWYDGVCHYSFVMPWDVNYEMAFRDIIQNNANECLAKMNCTDTNVIIDFFDWKTPEFKLCRVTYARTAYEQLGLNKMKAERESKVLNSYFTTVHDKTLDAELSNYDGNTD